MADEKLVEELAEVMHTANDGPDCDCHAAAREEFTVCAEAALAWLAGRGRLTPDAAETTEEWGVKIAGTSQPAPFHHRADAEAEIANCRAHGFTAARTLVRRERRWLDGMTLVGPWEPAPEETT